MEEYQPLLTPYNQPRFFLSHTTTTSTASSPRERFGSRVSHPSSCSSSFSLPERTAPSSFMNTNTTPTMAPSPPTPDNNPALARYIAKRQDKAGATVPSSLPSNHTNRPSNRTTQIVNPKNRFRTPSKPTNLEPGSFSHHSLPVTTASTSLRSILHAIYMLPSEHQ